MAAVTTKLKFDKARLTAFLTRPVNEFLDDKRIYQKAGQKVADRMRAVAQTGKQIGESLSSLQGLDPKTVKNRRKLQKNNRTGKLYNAAFSNLTFSGQLLKSIKVIDIRRGFFTVGPTGRRKTYKTAKNRNIKKTPENSRNEILGRIHNTGDGVPQRRFIGLDREGEKSLIQFFKRELRKKLRKFSKKKGK